jgi:hypothetical protein
MEPRSRYRWNVAAGRYISADGRFVTFAAVRHALDDALDAAELRLVALGERLRDRTLTVAEWQVQMAQELKYIHTTSAAAAKGGWAQMSPADYGRVGWRLREQYAYLARLAGEVTRGLPLDGRFMQRVRLYAQSGRLTFHMVLRAERRLRGDTEERNVLGVADHCRECVDTTARGWQAIGTLPLIGTRQCRSNCRCHIEYRRGSESQQ